MEVSWLEQTEADVASGTGWLSDAESAVLEGLRFPKRRADWILGRWTAKRAVTAWLEKGDSIEELSEVEIRATDSGAPVVRIRGRDAPIAISLTHRSGVAACAVAAGHAALGCDLEVIEPRSEAFVSCFLTPLEQWLVDSAERRDRTIALLWSAKESALKALEQGLRLDTRSVEVNVSADGQPAGIWSHLSVARIGGPIFEGWWRQEGLFVQTVVALPSPEEPRTLRLNLPEAVEALT